MKLLFSEKVCILVQGKQRAMSLGLDIDEYGGISQQHRLVEVEQNERAVTGYMGVMGHKNTGLRTAAKHKRGKECV